MRIGINVPNELLNRVKQIRPEVNVSQICREAIKDHVESYERTVAQVDSDGLNNHVIRLAESTAGSVAEPDWETYAIEDAREWVKVVDGYLWERFIYEYDHLVKNGRDGVSMVDIWSRGNGTKGFINRIYENNDWFDEQCEIDDTGEAILSAHEKARKGYARAWLGYVLEVRRRLEQHRKDEYKKLKAEREKYRQSLPDLELPPQLI